MKKILSFLAAAALVVACAAPAPTGTLKHVSPESMGMNSQKLNQIDREVARAIEEGNIPGCVVSVVRGDKIVFLKAYGNKQVVPDTVPMTTETIFDLASVSKCVGTTLSFMQLVENGYVNEYAFDWAMNISNRWYVGAGLRINSFSMSSEGKYQEWFNHYNTKGDMFYNYSQTRVLFNGVGASLAVGAIYRPAQWFRLGFGLETPSVSTFRTSTTGYFEAQADSVAPGSSSTNLPREFSGFHMPLHLSTSAAFQITNYALLAFQYDYFHQPGEIDRHSLRAGVEVVPYPGVYLNAGYAYESPFRKSYPLKEMDMSLERQDTYSLRTHRTQYISGAVGYRGRYLLVQAAYQYRMQRVKLWAHEAVNAPYDINADTHRVVVTIGWHR